MNKIIQSVRLLRSASESLLKKVGYSYQIQCSMRLLCDKQSLKSGVPALTHGYTKITKRQKKFPNNIENLVFYLIIRYNRVSNSPRGRSENTRYYAKRRESFNGIIQKIFRARYGYTKIGWGGLYGITK